MPLRLSHSCSCLRYFSARSRASPRSIAVEPGLVDHNGLRGLEHVEIDFLRHDADAGLGAIQFAIDVMAEHTDRAGALVDPAR